MPFALYEAPSEDDLFIRIRIIDSYKVLNMKSIERRNEALEGDNPVPIQRIVAAEEWDDFPITADLDELLELITENNHLYPESAYDR